MRLYFLLEGQTEVEIYRSWNSHFYKRGMQFTAVNTHGSHGYYIFSSKGFPSIYDDITNATKDCQKFGYDCLIICLDLDDNQKAMIEAEIDQRVRNASSNQTYRVIFQTPCIETWLLGNKKIFIRNPSQSDNFYSYFRHYDVSRDDPEAMRSASESYNTSQYHHQYLRAMLNPRRVFYCKGATVPKHVLSQSYLKSLVDRNRKDSHIKSFRTYTKLFEDFHLS